MRVLAVDDDATSALVLERFLQEMGYDVAVARNGREAYEMICSGDFRIVVSDWQMPEMSGLELCRRIRKRNLGSYVYLILLTCRRGLQNLVQALDAGADDFLTKPFNPDELSVRLRAAERIVTLEVRDLVIFSMARLAESRDPETGAHLERIREYARILAQELGRQPKYRDEIDADYVRTLYLTSPLHDIGKVGIPDSVLLKPGRLDPHEFEVMKQHTIIGGQTLDAALEAYPSAGFLQVARDIAWAHHERFDGKGYPRQLAGEEIPLGGRIVAVADVYDALTTRRVYKPAYSHEKARTIIAEGRGAAFDPAIVDAFLARQQDFIVVHRQMSAAMDSTTPAAPGALTNAEALESLVDAPAVPA